MSRIGLLKDIPRSVFHGGNAKINLNVDPVYRNIEEMPAYGFGFYTTDSEKLAGIYLRDWEQLPLRHDEVARSPEVGITAFDVMSNARFADWTSPYKSIVSNKEYDTFEDAFRHTSDRFNSLYKRKSNVDKEMRWRLSDLAASKYMRRYEKLDGWKAPATPVTEGFDDVAWFDGVSLDNTREFNIINPKVLFNQGTYDKEKFEVYDIRDTSHRRMRNELIKMRKRRGS